MTAADPLVVLYLCCAFRTPICPSFIRAAFGGISSLPVRSKMAAASVRIESSGDGF